MLEGFFYFTIVVLYWMNIFFVASLMFSRQIDNPLLGRCVFVYTQKVYKTSIKKSNVSFPVAFDFSRVISCCSVLQD